MAAPAESKVVIGAPKVGGAIYRAPLGTALPTDATAALNAAFISQGHVSTDGFTRAIEKAYATINAWGGEEVAKSRTELSVGANFNLIQSLDSDVNKTIFGEDAVTVTPADVSNGERIHIAYKGEELDASAWVIELAYKGRLRRIVIPNAQMTTESFEQTFSDEDVVPMPVELSMYKGATGTYFDDYTDDGVPTA